MSISVGILVILTTVLLARYPDAATKLNLINDNFAVALSINEAQAKGSAVESLNGVIGGYGVYLDMANPTKAIQFGDLINGSTSKNGIPIGDGLYSKMVINGTIVDEAKSTIQLPSGFTFTGLCVTDPPTGLPPYRRCSDKTDAFGSPQVRNLTITFIRPNPQPLIYINNVVFAYPEACIEMKSPQGKYTRSILVYDTGRITTQNAGCAR